MMFLIHVLEAVEREMRINLGSRNVGVAENSLHGAQVGAIFHHVRGAAVAQHVRAGMASDVKGSGVDHLPNALASEGARAATEK